MSARACPTDHRLPRHDQGAVWGLDLVRFVLSGDQHRTGRRQQRAGAATGHAQVPDAARRPEIYDLQRARTWKYRQLYMANLYAWRDPSPISLPTPVSSAVGPRNRKTLERLVEEAKVIIPHGKAIG